MQKNFILHAGAFLLLLSLLRCTAEEQPSGKQLYNFCAVDELIAKSRKCSCDIYFNDYMNRYQFTEIQSSFLSVGPPCNQKMMRITYFNAEHAHNEPDYSFDFYLTIENADAFFKKDTFQIDSMGIGHNNLTGGGWAPYYDVDVTLIWDTVSVNESVYEGKGKFIINRDIPHDFFTGYFYPAQEISFEFCRSGRVSNN